MKVITIQMPGFQQVLRVPEIPRKGEQVWIKNDNQAYVVSEVIHDYSESKSRILVNLYPKDRV